MGRVAPDLEDDGAESAAFDRAFGKPECIFQLAGRRMKEAAPRKAELKETDGIGQARFHRSHGIADPENRGEGAAAALLFLPLYAHRQSRSKTAGGPGIGQQPATDFTQTL